MDFSSNFTEISVTLSAEDSENFFIPPGFYSLGIELLKSTHKGKCIIIRVRWFGRARIFGYRIFEANEESKAKEFWYRTTSEYFHPHRLNRGCMEFIDPRGRSLGSTFA